MTLRTIVVVEDDPVQRLGAVEMLEAAGLNVAAFEDGERALAYIRQNREDVAGVFHRRRAGHRYERPGDRAARF